VSNKVGAYGESGWGRGPTGREGPPEVCLSADGGRGGDQPAFGPVRDRGQHRLQRTTPRGESVAHAHGRPWIYEPLDDALCLQLSQPLGQHSITDSGYAREQLIEPRRSWEQGFDDGPGPALPYQLDGALKGRAVVENPTDHGERFYSLSLVSETIRLSQFREKILQGLPSINP